jgi:hypothetical protein
VKLPSRDLFEGMNKTEKHRAIQLEALKRDGQIREWWYEQITLKLGDDCRYTPDFAIVDAEGLLRFEEVKGFWRDDAKVKIRVAAKQFPSKFTALQLVKGEWKREEF